MSVFVCLYLYGVCVHLCAYICNHLHLNTSSLDEFTGNEDSDGVPVAILANKQDLIGSETDNILVNVKELFNPLMSSIEARESKVFAVSALKGNGVLEALEWLLSRMEKNSLDRPPNFV